MMKYEKKKVMWKLIFNEIRIVVCYMSVTSSTADILNNEKTQTYWHADHGRKTNAGSYYVYSYDLYRFCKVMQLSEKAVRWLNK